MKKAFFAFTLLLVGVQSFSQNEAGINTRREPYLKKSKTEKIIGWSILGAGAVTIIAGAAISDKAIKKPDPEGLAVIGTGFAVSIFSIPFFIAAKHSANKAASLSVGSRRTIIPKQNGFALNNQLAVTLTLNVNRK